MSNGVSLDKWLKNQGVTRRSDEPSSPIEPQKDSIRTPEEPHMVSIRICPRCKLALPIESFKSKSSNQGYCQSCRKEYAKEMYTLHRKDVVKGVCPICLAEDKLVLDHSHSTNDVRDRLCRRCNVGLGMFKEDINSLSRAIAYLLKHKTN